MPPLVFLPLPNVGTLKLLLRLLRLSLALSLNARTPTAICGDSKNLFFERGNFLRIEGKLGMGKHCCVLFALSRRTMLHWLPQTISRECN